MAHVTFFTKSGCQTGAKQLATLQEAGHEVDVQSILDHNWTADELASYFGDLPVAQWFNRNSPRIKSGEVDPGAYDRASGLAAMCADPLLIRRPLMKVGDSMKCGFDLQDIAEWIGLSPQALERNEDLKSCSAVTAECKP